MNASNPITDLLTEAMDCADRLPDDPVSALCEAVGFVAEVVELPDWLPAFESLVRTMIQCRSNR